jgi:DNA-binding IclR family transcriptional regulator
MKKGPVGRPAKGDRMRRTKTSPLERYISMLEAVASAPHANLSELAGLCNLPFSSAHRVLHSLVRARFIVPAQRRRGEYILGPRLLRLLHSGLDESWLRITGQQVIDELARQLDDTCFINKLIGREVVTLAWAAPERQARGYLVPGVTQPLHASASAKAILAYQPADFIRDIMPAKLPKLCVDTKVKLKDLLMDFEQVRAQGYATCLNEFENGVGAIACPVFTAGGDVIYSVGMTGLIDRLSKNPIDRYTSAIRNASSVIARAIKHRNQSSLRSGQSLRLLGDDLGVGRH